MSNECPGCGLVSAGDDCDRCEYVNLASGRYHYCGDPACYCRNLPGLAAMYPEVRQRFLADHHARTEETP